MENNEIYKAIIKMAIKTARSITDDQEALTVKCLYKKLEKQIGKELEVGEYIQHDGKLYRVLKKHIVSEVTVIDEDELYVEIKGDEE